jgi:radical SAM superfamily enzyme YgiQ (UPF0313 family)
MLVSVLHVMAFLGFLCYEIRDRGLSPSYVAKIYYTEVELRYFENCSKMTYDAILISSHIDYDEEKKPILTYSQTSSVIPLGMLSIAQHLKNQGFSIRVIHLPSMDMEKTLTDHLRRNIADVVFIQCHWYLYGEGAVKVAEEYKRLFPDSKIFLGGFHATFYASEIMEKYAFIDGVILGESEKIAEEILSKSEGQMDIAEIPGLILRQAGQTIRVNEQDPNRVLPMEDIPVIELSSALFRELRINDYFYMNISRGRCPSDCGYCVANNPVFNVRKYQHLPLDIVLNQIEECKKAGVSEVFIGEIEFLDKKFIEDVAQAINDNGIDMSFRLETNPTLFSKSTTKKLVSAGFNRFTMGCESGSDALLKRVGRSTHTNRIFDAVRNITSNGAGVLTSWISNLPTETEEDYNKTLSAMRKVVELKGNVHWIENLHVLPGSKFFDHSEEYGIDPKFKHYEDWFNWARISKNLVDFKTLRRNPQKYFTHVENGKAMGLMVKRFYYMRKLARQFIDQRIASIETGQYVNEEIASKELSELEWYKDEGYKLLLF